jgi:enoyl-CoA hydratase/carnithine racemase
MVLSERDSAVALLTLNNPAQYNALGTKLMRDFQAALEHAIADPAVRVILLTGAGKGFCSGAQFGGDTFSQGAAIGMLMRQSINPLIERLRQSRKPVVTAVNGAAAGAGVGVALAGDVVFAARSARFILSFARLGAVLDGGTSQFLQRCIGAARARAGTDRRPTAGADRGRLGPGVAMRGRGARDGEALGRRRAAGAGDDQAPARRGMGRGPG